MKQGDDVMNIELKKATLSELNMIQRLYEKLLDSSESYADILQWKKGIYPTDEDWIYYIKNEEMYLLLVDGSLSGAVVVTKAQNSGYRSISWQIEAADEEVSVIHLLAIDPEQQGKGLAVAMLDLIMKMAVDMKKCAVRLDAIKTNIPAQRLYEKYGFVKCGTAQLYYESTGWTEFIFYEYLLELSKYVPF